MEGRIKQHKQKLHILYLFKQIWMSLGRGVCNTHERHQKCVQNVGLENLKSGVILKQLE
jgi:hypothetical protein